jgi:hypothetical protein
MTGTEMANRIRYSKVVRGELVYVIVDVHADGKMEFWSQEFGEVRWFAFVPDTAERLAALALPEPAEEAAEPNWPLLRLDTQLN